MTQTDRETIKDVVALYGLISIQDLKAVMGLLGWHPERVASAVRSGFDWEDLETGKYLWIKVRGPDHA